MANAKRTPSQRTGGSSDGRLFKAGGTVYRGDRPPAIGIPGDVWINPKTGMQHRWDGRMWSTYGPASGPGQPGPGAGSDPAAGQTGGEGFFDPKIRAIDTTNPHALPIIQLLSGWLTKMGSRAPDPQRGRGGPMSQLYKGTPSKVTPVTPPTTFNPAPLDPVNEGSRSIRSFQPQYMNQHTANNFDSEAFLRKL